MSQIVVFSKQNSVPESDTPRLDRQVSGLPLRTTWNHFTNATEEVFSGVWESEVGSWRIEMGAREDEFFHVLRGRCRLHAEDGTVFDCAAGESLVIPAGFKGLFEVIEPLCKHYMIVDRKPHS